MTTHYQKRLTSLQSKRKSFAQQPAVSSVPQPLVVELKKQEPPGRGFADKTAWDWLQLLIIPLALLLLGSLFSYQQNQTSLQASDRQHQTDLQIAGDQEQEATLKGYLDDMSDLLLNHSLRNSHPTDEVRQVARERTLTTLRRLNADRNVIVLQFLQDAHLIGSTTIIDLSNADLSNDDLRGVNLGFVELSRANLHKANLHGAILHGADLSFFPHTDDFLLGADLSNADLSNADLRGANLHEANLHGANLSSADLSDPSLIGSPHVIAVGHADLSMADLSNTNLHQANLLGADLRGVDLRGADLRGANLAVANLSGIDLRDHVLHGVNLADANLSGAAVSKEQLAQADSLQGTTMPDGSKHP